MAKRLKNLRVRRVDLVRQGASRDASDPDGPAARILLYKSADPPAPKPGEDTAAEPKCSECGEPLKEGARFCSQCGTKVEGEPTQKARSLPAGARRVEPVVEEPPKGATRAEWYAFLEARAGIAQLPLDKYLGTPEGSALYERYVSAPLMRDEPRSAPLVEPALDLTALREAAANAEREGGVQALLPRLRHGLAGAVLEGSGGVRVGAHLRRAGGAGQKLGDDPAIKTRADARAHVLKIAPGFEKVRSELLDLARAGANIAEIEKRSPARRAVVRKLIEATTAEVKKMAGAPEPQRVTFTKAVETVLGERPGLAAALSSGRPEDADRIPWTLAQVRTDLAAYKAYRAAVLRGSPAPDDGPEAA